MEAGLRVVGVGAPVRPRLILRLMDSDITLPFMRADPEVFWSPIPGYPGEFMGKPVRINALGLRGPEIADPRPPAAGAWPPSATRSPSDTGWGTRRPIRTRWGKSWRPAAWR